MSLTTIHSKPLPSVNPSFLFRFEIDSILVTTAARESTLGLTEPRIWVQGFLIGIAEAPFVGLHIAVLRKLEGLTSSASGV